MIETGETASGALNNVEKKYRRNTLQIAKRLTHISVCHRISLNLSTSYISSTEFSLAVPALLCSMFLHFTTHCAREYYAPQNHSNLKNGTTV